MSVESEEKIEKEQFWTSEKIMSISALFVSAISLIALFYQLNLAREENELIRKQQSASVLPYLSQWSSNTSNSLKIIFGNKGVGPAFIKKVTFEINDTVFYNSDHLFDYIMTNIYKKDSIKLSALTSTFSKGYVLPANETIEIITMNDVKDINTLRKFMSDKTLDCTVIYADVYGTQWSLSSKNDNSITKITKD